jgi:LysR family glycine cleavage system transcriptional activator
MLRQRRDGVSELWISALPFFTSTVLLPALPDFRRRNPGLTLRIEATHQYADFNASRVDVAIRYGREHSTGLKFEPLVAVSGLPVCAPALTKGGLRTPEDLSGQVLIHLTTQPRSWPAWLKDAGVPDLAARGHLWLDSVPAMLEAAEHGLGVTLAMAPLIRHGRDSAKNWSRRSMCRSAAWRRSIWCPAPNRRGTGVLRRCGDGSWKRSAARKGNARR